MQRNLFELDNARYLNKKELIDTFIPTPAFDRILSPKNQIIIGSRGSGKTALLKMVSHDHLSLLNTEKAKEIIESKLYIGIHISTKTKFVGGLKNKDWQTDADKEHHFRWLMNVAACNALLETIKSCLKTYYAETHERITVEIDLIRKISSLWFPEDDKLSTINNLEEKLSDTVFKKSRILVERKMYNKIGSNIPGATFDMELFDPVIAAIDVVNRKLSFPEQTSWFICIDEIEILDEFHHRILNSYMRANSGNIFFKFTTLPYCHYTLETNTNVPLEVRHDVQYIYIDQDATFKYKATTADNSTLQLFQARARLSKPEFAQFDLKQLFGYSRLLDRFAIDIDESMSDKEFNELFQSNEFIKLFNKYASEPTLSRGLVLLRHDIGRFGNEIGRKMRGLILLRDEFEKTKRGNHSLTIYSGAKIVVKVGDANPRKLLGIFNEMLKKFDSSTSIQKRFQQKMREGVYRSFTKYNADPIIPFSEQHFVLVSMADRELNKSRIEKNFGKGLYDFMTSVGEFMKNNIHENKLSTEQISSIEVNSSIDDNTWAIIQRAVQKGLLYPNRNVNNPDEMPYKEGTFHLAYILAPKFKLLPRRGDSRNVLTILPTQLTFEFHA